MAELKRMRTRQKSDQGERRTCVEGDSKNPRTKKKFEGKCYNCGKKGHMAKDCWSKKGLVESNAATSKSEEDEVEREMRNSVWERERAKSRI